MSFKLNFKIFALAFGLSFLFVLNVFGQATGGLHGTVKDQNGALVPGATVEVKHTSTNLTRTVTTTEDGEWTATILPVGTYSVTFYKDGFKKAVSENIAVEASVVRPVETTLEVGVSEVAVGDAPVGDGACDAMNELPHARLTLTRVLLAVKIFRDRYLGRERAPAFGNFDVFLLKNHFATIIGDFRDAPFPFDLIKWRNSGIAEHALKTQAGPFLFVGLVSSAHGRFMWSFQ